MGIRMLVPLLMLGMFATSAYADCDACVAGSCYSRRTLIQGFPITDQLAIDRTNNVLYAQINSNLNIAFFLDDNRMQLVQMMKTSGMTVDQDSQILYMGTNEIDMTYYKYNLTSNITETQHLNKTLKTHRHPDLILYSSNKLYYVGKSLNTVRYIDVAEGNLRRFKYLMKYFISDVVIDNENKFFFVSNNTVFVYALNHPENQPTVILQKDHVLSTDENGVVYFGDASQKVIYKRDTTGDLDVYAVYKTGSLEDFVFDRNNNVVFRDGDGSIAQWVRASDQARCDVDPPHDGFIIREVEVEDQVPQFLPHDSHQFQD